MPPLTRFLYTINSGMTPDVAEVGKLMELRRKPMAILQMAQRIPKMMNQHYYQKKKKKTWWINIRGRRSGSYWIGYRLSIIRCQETKSKIQSCSMNCCTIEIMLIGKETPYLFMRIGMISNMASEPFVLCVWVMHNPVYPWFSEAIKGIEMCLLTDRYSFSF